MFLSCFTHCVVSHPTVHLTKDIFIKRHWFLGHEKHCLNFFFFINEGSRQKQGQTKAATSFIYWKGGVNPWGGTHYFNVMTSDQTLGGPPACLSCRSVITAPHHPPHSPSTLQPAVQLSRSDYNFLALAVCLSRYTQAGPSACRPLKP